MKFELFLDQPNLELKKGIKVDAKTETTYKSDNVEQVIKDLRLETVMSEEGGNGLNTYKSKSYISINLNEGDILLFDAERGYYLPAYPKTSIAEAIEDISALKDLKLEEE